MNIRQVVCTILSGALLGVSFSSYAAPEDDDLINSLLEQKGYPQNNQPYSGNAYHNYSSAEEEDDYNTVAPYLNSSSALVINSVTGQPYFQKNVQTRRPIASITKLMTAIVVLDSELPMDEMITITDEDIDRLKGSSSRLQVGTTLPRREMLLLALMSSENRAANSLARTYPGGVDAFIARMNRKARGLGMRSTAFYDATGLNKNNVSTAADLALMVKEAYKYPLIRQDSTWRTHSVIAANGKELNYNNSNMLVREGVWDISLQKTGYIREAGRCMVVHANVGTQPLIIVLLNSGDSLKRANDARALKTWLERQPSYLLQEG